jgi:hypothetical protein
LQVLLLSSLSSSSWPLQSFNSCLARKQRAKTSHLETQCWLDFPEEFVMYVLSVWEDSGLLGVLFGFFGFESIWTPAHLPGSEQRESIPSQLFRLSLWRL